MGCAVYANGMSIACKVADGKTIAAMPDVCLSPPTPPAGPVPLPYPNTAMASDTDNGSKTVQIGGQEVMLKDQSTFKKSSGDEAATKSLGMGVVSHQIQGTVAFVAWSMDVKFEGENVPRHLDLTLHNGASAPYDTPTWPYIDTMAEGGGKGCESERESVKEKCSGDADEDCKNPACQKAKKCMLVPYAPIGEQTGCCPGETPHHLVEVHCFTPPGGRREGKVLQQFTGYNPYRAPCVCVTGSRYTETHGQMHAIQNRAELRFMNLSGPRSQMGGSGDAWNFGSAKEAAVKAHQTTFPDSGADGKPCSEGCLNAQLTNYHKQFGVTDDQTPLRADMSPLQDWQKEWGDEQLGDMFQNIPSTNGYPPT